MRFGALTLRLTKIVKMILVMILAPIYSDAEANADTGIEVVNIPIQL